MKPLALAAILALGLLAAPLAAEAQPARQGTSKPRVGFILSNNRLVTKEDWSNWSIRAFLEGFREHGWLDGQNITIEWRGAAGQPERIPALVRELVGLSRRSHRGEQLR